MATLQPQVQQVPQPQQQQQQQPVLVYPVTKQPVPESTHHSSGSFGTVFIVLAVIVVISGIACCLGRLCNRKAHKHSPTKPHKSQKSRPKGGEPDSRNRNFRPKDGDPHFQPKQGDIEFGKSSFGPKEGYVESFGNRSFRSKDGDRDPEFGNPHFQPKQGENEFMKNSYGPGPGPALGPREGYVETFGNRSTRSKDGDFEFGFDKKNPNHGKQNGNRDSSRGHKPYEHGEVKYHGHGHGGHMGP
ncbi:hypothetical protein F8388_014841 [Cannabis sativa]|uniref:Transmembrane protein n=1 Tax=Cannabis sativa TaxID=3483 RepID=A0A7J6HLX0_CANSA|nr:hypothetical protein F8388_014841 [Cannabis sativa]KAF4395530.1 hypothetical protein G4B88_010994 [Cannabis sativa]